MSADVHRIRFVTLVAMTGGVALELIYAFGSGKVCAALGVFGVLGLASAAALATGAVVGFIFGVPKSGAPRLQLVMTGTSGQGTVKDLEDAAGQAARNYKPNTNLEVMSDWLAGVIVGAGLVGLKDLVRWFGDLCTQLAAWMPEARYAGIAAGGAILSFFSLGFLSVYLLTRLFLTQAFERAEGGAQPGGAGTTPGSPPLDPEVLMEGKGGVRIPAGRGVEGDMKVVP